MEPNEFQAHVIKRLQKLEAETFKGTFEENYGSAREEAEAISKGNAPNHFIGERTKESAEQRIRAFYQNYDRGSVNSLYGDELDQYKKEGKIVEMLINRYDLHKLVEGLIR